MKAPRLIFTDSTLRCLREECTQGTHYISRVIGYGRYEVRRADIATEKVRTVQVAETSFCGLDCSCGRDKDELKACRHIYRIAWDFPEHAAAASTKAAADVFLLDKYIADFKDLDVRLPAEEDIAACKGQKDFPDGLLLPHIKKGRGRPRVKRIHGFRSRAQVANFNQSMGLDDDDNQRRCSCCRYPGHTLRTCTWRSAFTSVPEEDGLLGYNGKQAHLCIGSALTFWAGRHGLATAGGRARCRLRGELGAKAPMWR